MEQVHRDVIRGNLMRLIDDIDADSLLICLLQEGVFTDHQVEAIKVERTSLLKNQKICMDIQTRGPMAFSNLIKCLYMTDQTHLAQLLVLKEFNAVNRLSYDAFSELPHDVQNRYTCI